MNLQNERFFITGATGFVGACLTRKLVSIGCEVHILIRDKASKWRLRGIEDKLHIHIGNLNDAEAVRNIVSDVQPTIVYHLAVHGAYPTQNDADQIILTDVFGTWNLLKACSEVDYKVFINTGSSSEYGAKQSAMREDDLLEPNSYYAVAKSAQSLVCQHMARADRRPINTFRLFSVYGEYEEPTRLVPTLIRRSLEGRPLDMVSPDTTRDFIHVDDVIAAYLQVGQLNLQCGEVFNIGTGVQTTMREIVRSVMQSTHNTVKVNWGSMQARTWDTETWLADISKVRRVLKWSPKIGLAEGIEKTTVWYRQWEDGERTWSQAACA